MENNFSAENSLRLITETIERSRRAVAKNAGKPLILWGALVSITAFVIWILWSKTGSPAWNFLWFAMSVIGFLGNRYLDRDKEKVPATEVTRLIGKIWMWFGILSTGFFALVWAAWGIRCAVGIEGPLNVDLTMIILMMMGLCGAISGSVLKLKSVTIPVVIALALAATFLMVMPSGSPVRILSFVILGVLALIVPGVILQKNEKKQ
ncbi:MAG: hypothetical protein II851_04140 [Bacteroidales bacterium]|nr:hypothetical protein [Bacteroidales bacterium]